MKKLRNAVFYLVAVVCLLFGGHLYLEYTIRRVISEQIELNKDRIKTEMKEEILSSLEDDEDTQQQVQGLMQTVVAKELETNGDKYIRQIIKDKYPFLEVYLAAQEPQ